MNEAMAKAAPPHLLWREQEIAIDYHDQAYYAKTEQQTGLWFTAEAKDGTTRVYRVATAYIIVRDLRLTPAIRKRNSADQVTILDNKIVARPRRRHSPQRAAPRAECVCPLVEGR